MHLEPVVDAHAAAFIGCTPWDVAHDATLLADAHRTAWSSYRQRTVVVGVDRFTLEAAAWGAQVRPGAEPGAPFVIEQPLVDDLRAVTTLPYLDPNTSTRLLTVFEAAGRLLAEVPAKVAVPVTGPLALAAAVAGAEAVREAAARDPVETRDLLVSLVKKLRPWIHAIARCGAQAVIIEAPYDPAVVSPVQYADCVQPALRTLGQILRAETCFAPSLLASGDTAPIARRLAEVGVGLLNCPAEADRAAFLEQVRGFPDLAVQLDLSCTLWCDGDWPGVCRAIADAIPAARNHDHLFLGTGPLPLAASSVTVVDACNFASRMDPWMDPM